MSKPIEMQMEGYEVAEKEERRLEKPDWKQWLPLYGIYQIRKDGSESKPTIVDRSFAAYYGMGVYHAFWLAATVSGMIGYPILFNR